MNILLLDPDDPSRSEVARSLRGEGLAVRTFADDGLGFLYLMARFDEIDAVAVNTDTDAGRGVVRRMESLDPIAVVTYSGRDLDDGGAIVGGLLPRADRA